MPSTKKLLQAAAGSAGEDNLYVEDVFSTFLFTAKSGTTDNGDMVNNINLADEGGMVWIKDRTEAYSHSLIDTERGNTKRLKSDTTAAQSDTGTYGLLAFNTDGFELGTGGGAMWGRDTGNNQVATWTFRKAEKFFDIVTYTGDATSDRQISHNLGSVPGLMIVKQTDFPREWSVYHTSLGATKALNLNLTSAASTISAYWNDTSPTDTEFTVGYYNRVNNDSSPYVAYLFASDAGGFGDDGDENIIKCGSYTGTGGAGTPPVINLGFEPQWLLVKNTSADGNWMLMDTMRGWGVDGSDSGPKELRPNTSEVEFNWGQYGYDLWTVNPTGFTVGPTDLYNVNNTTGATYIYMAIRRPMKTPESGTEVFDLTLTENASEPFVSSAFPVDTGLVGYRSSGGFYWGDRIRGANELTPSSTAAEGGGSMWQWDYQDGWLASSSGANLFYSFKRATGFMDVVAYNGDNVEPRAIAHGLGVVPEMIIIKNRSGPYDWVVYHSGNTADPATEYLHLNANYATIDDDAMWKDTAPTASVFTTGNAFQNNHISSSYVAYLFASVAGVSKVGSYTGTGSNVDVDCGFAAGARFILIKRTDSTGDWYVWDSARGIVAGNDPYLLLNTTAAEVTNTDYIDPLSSGFTVTSSAPAALNASGGTYIFLAIA